MNSSVINVGDEVDRFSDCWGPKVVARMSDYQFKVVKSQGGARIK
jgi:hypothetical protein